MLRTQACMASKTVVPFPKNGSQEEEEQFEGAAPLNSLVEQRGAERKAQGWAR